jgi:hypothetical protein
MQAQHSSGRLSVMLVAKRNRSVINGIALAWEALGAPVPTSVGVTMLKALRIGSDSDAASALNARFANAQQYLTCGRALGDHIFLQAYTIYVSKGFEADIVIVLDACSVNRWPTKTELDQCLLYVALSRARLRVISVDVCE